MKITGVTCLCVSRRLPPCLPTRVGAAGKSWQQVSTGTFILVLAFSCCFSNLYAQKNQEQKTVEKKQTAIGSYATLGSAYFAEAASAAKAESSLRSTSLKSEGIKFSPDFFPILPWESQHGFWKPFISKRKYGLPSIAECNFTMAGFVRPEDLPLCEKLGLAAIMFGDTGLTRSKEWSELSDEEIDRKIRQMVEESGDSKAIIGYFITDEPGASAFPALAKAVRAVKKYAPGKLAYINLLPNATVRRSVIAPSGDKDKSQLETDSYTEYLEKFAGEIFGDKDKSLLGTDSYTEYLEKFVNEVKPQIISYDNYAVQYSRDLKDSIGAAVYYANLMEVRRIALKYDLPFWNIVSSNQIRPYTTIPSPSNLLFQAYTTLAAGGRGISWYKYYSGGYGYAPIDESENKTLTWRYLQEVNRQIATLGPVMNRLTSIGVYFTSASVEPLPALPGKLVREIKSDTPMMVGEFKSNDGTNYVMVVNLSLEKSAKFVLKTVKPHKKMQVVSAEDGTLRRMDNKTGLWLVAGQGVLIKLL